MKKETITSSKQKVSQKRNLTVISVSEEKSTRVLIKISEGTTNRRIIPENREKDKWQTTNITMLNGGNRVLSLKPGVRKCYEPHSHSYSM